MIMKIIFQKKERYDRKKEQKKKEKNSSEAGFFK